jgi:hypothetical protein
MLMRQDFDLQTAGAEVPEAKTFTGNRGLEIEEGLIFDRPAGGYRRRSRRTLAI